MIGWLGMQLFFLLLFLLAVVDVALPFEHLLGQRSDRRKGRKRILGGRRRIVSGDGGGTAEGGELRTSGIIGTSRARKQQMIAARFPTREGDGAQGGNVGSGDGPGEELDLC